MYVEKVGYGLNGEIVVPAELLLLEAKYTLPYIQDFINVCNVRY